MDAPDPGSNMARHRKNVRKVSRDEETIHLINTALTKKDVKELRQIASVRGLVSDSLRRRVWPLLLGLDIDTQTDGHQRLNEPTTARAQRDDATITVDIVRCLHETNKYINDDNRDRTRAQLAHLLRCIVDGEHIYYYQGLHELASVVLLSVGESMSFTVLKRLVVTHLRDNTRSTLDATMEALNLIFPIICAVDPLLGTHLQQADIPPYFAISWLITWFAHDVKQVDTQARLFDLFLSTHPLMPLYFGVSAMIAMRRTILKQDCMEDIHTLLVKMDIESTGKSIDELTASAIKIMHDHPPLRVIHRSGAATRHCSTVEAKLIQGVWWVPEKPAPVGNSVWGGTALNSWLRTPMPTRLSAAGSRLVFSFAGVATLSAVITICISLYGSMANSSYRN